MTLNRVYSTNIQFSLVIGSLVDAAIVRTLAEEGGELQVTSIERGRGDSVVSVERRGHTLRNPQGRDM